MLFLHPSLLALESVGSVPSPWLALPGLPLAGPLSYPCSPFSSAPWVMQSSLPPLGDRLPFVVSSGCWNKACRPLFLRALQAASPRSRCWPVWFWVRAFFLACDGHLLKLCLHMIVTDTWYHFLSFIGHSSHREGFTLMLSSIPNCLQRPSLHVPSPLEMGLQYMNWVAVEGRQGQNAFRPVIPVH